MQTITIFLDQHSKNKSKIFLKKTSFILKIKKTKFKHKNKTYNKQKKH